MKNILDLAITPQHRTIINVVTYARIFSTRTVNSKHAWLAIDPLSLRGGKSRKTSHALVSAKVLWLKYSFWKMKEIDARYCYTYFHIKHFNSFNYLPPYKSCVKGEFSSSSEEFSSLSWSLWWDILFTEGTKDKRWSDVIVLKKKKFKYNLKTKQIRILVHYCIVFYLLFP